MKFKILFFIILLSSTVLAFNPIFIGTTSYSGSYPICSKSPSLVSYGYSPQDILNPFIGETISFTLDNSSLNQQIISLLGNNSGTFDESCLPNGNLIETACGSQYTSYGYSQNSIGAIDISPLDLLNFGAQNSNWSCHQWRRGSNNSVYKVPAYYVPTSPQGYTLINQTSLPGPSISYTYAPFLSLLSGWGIPASGESMFEVSIIGPAPSQTILNSSLCSTGPSCFGGTISISCPNVYFVRGLQTNGISNFESFAC